MLQSLFRQEPPTAPGQVVDEALRQRIEDERVRILYTIAPFAVVIHVLAGGLLAYSMRNAVQGSSLALWCLAMGVVCFGRWALYRSYLATAKLPGELRGWEMRFAGGVFATALVWSAMVLFMFPSHSVPHQLLTIFVASAIAIGSAGATQASPIAFVAFVGTVLLAVFVRLLMTGQDVFIYLALMILVCFPATTSLFMRLNREIHESLEARFRNENLAGDLASTRASHEQALLEEKGILDTAMMGVAFIRDRRIIRCNRTMEEMFGFEAGSLTDRSTRVLYATDQSWNDTMKRVDASLGASGFHDEELEFYRRDGAPLFCRCAGRLLDPADMSRGAVWVFADISARRSAEQKLARANAALIDTIETVPDALALFDRDDRLVVCNTRYAQGIGPSGVSKEEAVGMSFENIARKSIARGQPIPPEFKNDPDAWLAERIRRHRHSEDEYLQQYADGRWMRVRDRRTSEGGILAVRTDVTELHNNQVRVEFLANHDPLTELPNRRLLEDRMAQSLSLARRNQSVLALMLVDLDNFKQINDRHGHRIGDEVLRESAQRLRACVREVDTVSRLGGDEFVLVLSELRQSEDAEIVARKVLNALAAPIEFEGRTLAVQCSIGIALHPAHGEDGDALLKAADAAMYRAKDAGRHRAFFVDGGEPIGMD